MGKEHRDAQCRAKYEERKVAKDLGCYRKLRRGTDEKEDIEHPFLCIDVKVRKKLGIFTAFEVLQQWAKRVGKIPVLMWRQPHKKTRLVVMEYNDWLKVADKMNWVIKQKGGNDDR